MIHADHAAPPRLREAGRDVPLAPAVDRGVHRQAERVVSRGDRALEVILDEGIIAAHVELIDAQTAGCRRGRGFDPRLRHRAQEHRHPELGRGLGDGGAAAFCVDEKTLIP